MHKYDKFLYQCLEGKVNFEDIDNFIDDWNDSDSKDELYKFLGLSRAEYALYIEKPTALPSIVMSHRFETSIPNYFWRCNALWGIVLSALFREAFIPWV